MAKAKFVNGEYDPTWQPKKVEFITKCSCCGREVTLYQSRVVACPHCKNEMLLEEGEKPNLPNQEYMPRWKREWLAKKAEKEMIATEKRNQKRWKKYEEERSRTVDPDGAGENWEDPDF